MCEDTVQLTCGVVMNAKLFTSRRYGHVLVAHGATIVPLIAGMFISGLLYGELLLQSQIPNIDSMAQLNESGLTIYGAPYENEDFRRLTNIQETRLRFHNAYYIQGSSQFHFSK